MSQDLTIRQIPAEPAQPAEAAPAIEIDVQPVTNLAIVQVVDESTAAPTSPGAADEAPAAQPEPQPEPRIWPVPTEESIAAYHRVYQQAQLHLLDRFSASYDPEMLDKQLAGANIALREAWQVWRQTALPLSIVEANNLLRRTGQNHLAEGRYGQGVAGMTIVAWEPGLGGSKLPVYGVRQSGNADDEAIDEIRAAWRAKAQQVLAFVLERLRVYGFSSDDLKVAIEQTLP